MKNIFRFFPKSRISGALVLLAPFVVLPEASAYCVSKGNNTSYEWIERFELASFQNSSGADGGYADVTQEVISLASGSVPISLEPGFRGSSYKEHWRVWIDFNQDENFQATEQVFSGSSVGALLGSITISNDVPAGDTRMRVSMKYGSAPGACESFTYGEVEDYTVRFDTVDTSSPAVVLTNPLDSETDIDVTSTVSIVFSELIDPFSVNQSSVTLLSEGVVVDGSTSVDDAVVTFTPMSR